MTITRGPVKTALRVGIYGVEGIGKSTFASQFPGAVFIDTEGSTRHMDVFRFDPPESLNDVMEQLNYIASAPKDVRTVVIDTVDWLEKFLFKAVCEEKKVNNIEDIGYGKGYVYAKQKMQGILELLDVIISRGIHVVLVCHSMIRKFELPDEMGSYDRYMLKLNEKNIAPLIKEWVDMLLFVNWKTDVITDADGKTKKGKGGQKRIMYASHSACWDAKNRFGLPDEMPFEFGKIAHLFATETATGATDATAVAKEDPGTEKARSAQKDTKAEVTTAEKVPEEPKTALQAKVDAICGKGSKAARKTASETPDTTRPESMASEDPDKDALLEQLWNKMLIRQIYDPMILQAVVAEKEYYDLNVPVRNYDPEFIENLIDLWESQISGLCISKKHDLPF